MARIAERSKLTPEEYLAWERLQPYKHEYFDGDVFAMSGGTPRHNRLSSSINAALVSSLGTRCSVFTSDQRLRVQDRRYVYPDVVVVCGPPVVEHDDVITNPTIVVEVLSQSTEQYDRGLKWDGYQTRASLTDYVLVSQDRARIEHFGRGLDRRWTYAAANAGESITLTDGTILDVDAIFAGAFELKGD
jgi:Uma2 family endonuclease